MRGLDGTVALISGASSGIGRATATRFAEEGASVVVADIDAEGGEETISRIANDGGEATFVETDVTDQDDVASAVETAVDAYGGLDVAFNNAGIEGEQVGFGDQSNDNWERVVGINLSGVFYAMREEIPAMLESGGGGSIVNTASIAGILGFPNLSPYVASKHGVVGLTRSAAVEFAADGIRVNAVLPGVIDTPMVQRSGEADPESTEQTVAAIPADRLGEPEEIASTVAWLGSDDAAYVTGQPITVDGGYSVQ
ncbi:glucose 1-dehydrogenase [Halovivax cerinus]|uniref:Glucose 1-dehydrogenase n=1 Tax=Halovivax cerinus TaxID=1487865 RepID=A0ABD5NQX8_9EURY|nr:glucose 1-dehydrogenase [Halovivax cerinus]